MELDIWVIRSVNFGWMDHSIKKKKERMDGLVIKLSMWLVILYACFICSELFSMSSYFTRHLGDLAQFQGQWPFQFKGQSALEASLMYAVCKQLLIFSIFFSFSPIFRHLGWLCLLCELQSMFMEWARTCILLHIEPELATLFTNQILSQLHCPIEVVILENRKVLTNSWGSFTCFWFILIYFWCWILSVEFYI